MKIYRPLLIVIIVILLALTACSSDGNGDTGASEFEPTSVANVPEQPDESVPEEEEPVEAPEISKSDGLFDTEAMVENLDDYVLRVEDMPNQYKIVADGEQHLTNLKVINTVGR